MDMRITGSGIISAGEYDRISVAGSGHVTGQVSCRSMDIAGSVRADADVFCSGAVSTAGSSRFAGSLTAGSIETAGSAEIGGDLTVITTAECAGSLRAGKSIKGGRLKLAGKTEVGTEIEADELTADGCLTCPGLLNAEKIVVRFGTGCVVGSVGGNSILIRPEDSVKKTRQSLFLFNKNRNAGYFDVRESIEGDDIDLSYVKCPAVTGKTVNVGPYCVLDSVRYTDKVSIDPTATVTHLEQVEQGGGTV